GVFSAMYGLRMLAQTPAFGLLPSSVWPARPYLIALVNYFILVPASLFWLDLSLGWLRRLIEATVIAAITIGVAGIAAMFVSGSADRLKPYNELLVIALLLVLGAVNVIPKLARRLVTVSPPVLTGGALILAAAALYANLSGLLGYPSRPVEP